MRGQDVGVHVEHDPLAIHAEAGDDRDAADAEQIHQECRSGAVRLAHEAEVGHLAADRLEKRRARAQTELSVGAGDAHRPSACGPNRCDERGVRPAREDRDHGVERRVVRNPEAVDEARRQSLRFELGIDRASAAVYDDERDRGRETDNRLGRRADRGCVFEQLSAELENSLHRFRVVCVVRGSS